MARLNFLRGTLSGTLGEIYATTQHGQTVVKKRPLPKAHPTDKQTANVRAFEALNRLSVQFAKRFWAWLGLSDRTMLRHNAVARAMRVMVGGGEFSPLAFTSIIPSIPEINITPPAQDAPGAPITTSVIISAGYAPPPGALIHALAVDAAGYCGPAFTAPFTTDPFALTPPAPQERAVFVLFFCSYADNKKARAFAGRAAEVMWQR